MHAGKSWVAARCESERIGRADRRFLRSLAFCLALSAVFGFATVADADMIASFDMTKDPRWTVEGQWDHGQPLGAGGTLNGAPDPSAGATGANVIGVNLAGDYSLAVGGPWHVTTNAINCSDYEDVTLEFKRWLNTDSGDVVSAFIQVSNNGSTWFTIWSNGASPITDVKWLAQSYDISLYADGRSTVYVRWGYRVGKTASAYSGWNIDDVTFTGNKLPEVTSVSPASGETIYASVVDVNVNVSFSEFVTGVSAADMELSGSAATTASVGTPTFLGLNTWRFPISGLSPGVLEVDLAPDANDIQDVDGGDLNPSPTSWSYAVSGPLEYRFERMLPTLSQPWYFATTGLAVVEPDVLIVADAGHHRLMKLSKSGQFLSQWGGVGTGPGQFQEWIGVAVGPDGNIYTADFTSRRVQKFDPEGVFLTEWGSSGSGPGQFGSIRTLAVDTESNVYVTDPNHDRVQKFDSDGNYLLEWSVPSTGRPPIGIAVDRFDEVYVAVDESIRKYDSDGNLITQWGQGGSNPGEFEGEIGLAVDRVSDVLYVGDARNYRVQTFDLDGTFRTSWFVRGEARYIAVDAEGNAYVAYDDSTSVDKYSPDGLLLTSFESAGTGAGEFFIPYGMGLDDAGSVYVGDTFNDRVQKFTESGVFVAEWGTRGTGAGEFRAPFDVATDSSGNVYVADSDNDRIQKFDSNGVYIRSYGTFGSGNGEFNTPSGLALDGNDDLIIADSSNHRIQKIAQDGTYLLQWGSQGSATGQFNRPRGVAVDSVGNVYVADTQNSRIQKFTSTGVFVREFDDQLFHPWGISIGPDDHLFVTNEEAIWGMHRFTPDGVYIPTSLAFDGVGSFPGQFSFALGLELNSAGDVFIADTLHSRLQKFKPVTVANNSKAVVLSGGGAFPGNDLWDATQASANFAYQTLAFQGFTKESTYYLSSDTDLDLSGSGTPDVDADATNANLQYALETWATDLVSGLPTGDVVVYLVDHGGDETFRMSGTETLTATELGQWLETLEAGIDGSLIVVYDACQSGTFQNALASAGRTVITSTSPGESAYFLSTGTISFSNFFWTQIFNGEDVGTAYDFARSAVGQAFGAQHPQLNVDGDAVYDETEGDRDALDGVFIGSGTDFFLGRPTLGSVSAPQDITGTSTATIEAFGVTDPEGDDLARVWGVIRPPDFVPVDPGNPIEEMPTVDLVRVGATDDFTGTYDGFTTPGSYQLTLYAMDTNLNVSSPLSTTVTVDSPLKRRAILVGTGDGSAPEWPAYENVLGAAYEALKFQGYDDEDIALRSPVSFIPGVDGLPSLSNLEYLLTNWATQDTYDVVLYMVGRGNPGSFALNAGESVSALQLDGWLDLLQDPTTGIPGTVAVVYDANFSGSFVPALVPPTDRNRIAIASARESEPARFLSTGEISFSSYFWTRVLNGASTRSAFKHAQVAMRLGGYGQRATWDDNGNGIPDEKQEGLLALVHNIGTGILLAGDEPLIGSINGATQLNGSSSFTVWVEDVTTTGTLEEVAVTITPPGGGNPLTFPMLNAGGGRYEYTYGGFELEGVYGISVVATDADGNASLPAETTVEQTVGIGATPDAFEDDDTSGTATAADLNVGVHDAHTFHDFGDEDWYEFTADAGDLVTIETYNLGPQADTALTIYQSDGTTEVLSDDDSNPDDFDIRGELVIFQPDLTATYFLKVTTSSSATISPTFGPDASYDLRIVREVGGCFPAQAFVDVTNTLGQAVTGATVVMSSGPLALIAQDFGDGSYFFADIPELGVYTFDVSAAGHTTSIGETLNHDTCGGFYQSAIQLSPTSPPADPVLLLAPGSVDFGVVAPGGDSTLEVSVTNIGGGTLSGSVGGIAAPFEVVTGGEYAGLGAGQSANVTLRYAPDGFRVNDSDEIEFSVSGGDSVHGTLTGQSTLEPEAIADSALILQDLLADAAWADGLLSFDEAAGLIAGLTLDMFDALDANDDGFVSITELLELTVGPVGVVRHVWVDATNTGEETGREAHPFDTVREGAAYVESGGILHILAGNYDESLVLDRNVSLTAEQASKNDPVRIGASSAPASPPSSVATRDGTASEAAPDWPRLASKETASGEEADGARVSDDSDARPDTVETHIFEPVLPYRRTENGERLLVGSEAVSIRLLSNAAIDPNSLWAQVPGGIRDRVVVDWFSVGEAGTDVWVRIQPEADWQELLLEVDSDRPVLAVAAGGASGGKSIESRTFSFVVDDRAGAASADELVGGVGEAVPIDPQMAFLDSQLIELPIPRDLSGDLVELYYFNAEHDWLPADRLVGFLAGPVRVENVRDTPTLTFQVNHAGIIQLRSMR